MGDKAAAAAGGCLWLIGMVGSFVVGLLVIYALHLIGLY